MGLTHLVLSLTPSQSYVVLVDRFTTSIRQHVLSLPGLWSFMLKGGLFKPIPVFTTLISQDLSFFNLTLENLDFVWQSYFVQVQTKSCYQPISSFSGYSYLSLEQQDLNEYYWPFMPIKGSHYQFTLRLNRDNVHSQVKPLLTIHLEPNCGFEVLAKFSIIDFSAQIVKHYFVLLVPIIISTAILVISVKLSNMPLLYSYSDEEWHKFKSQINVQNSKDIYEGNALFNNKCILFLSTSQVMFKWRFFLYCYSQIIIYSLICLFILAR